MKRPLRILVVAPFAHQNGHFVTFPRDIACALDANGCDVVVLHPRPFRTALDWRGTDVTRICLRDSLDQSPWWWKEIWSRLAGSPSALCLAWIIWQVRGQAFDLVLWTDFQAQPNVWPLRLARLLGLYRWRTAFFEHHPPDDRGRLAALLPGSRGLDRIRTAGTAMFVVSSDLLGQWKSRLGPGRDLFYVPWGLWPQPASEMQRADARQALRIDERSRVLLVFGVQAVKRKHLDTLREALSTLVPEKPLTLLFVGATLAQARHPFSDWQRPEIDIRIVDGFVPEDDVATYFAAADAVWANYRAFPGASGVLLQAMGFGRISIASGEGEIGVLCTQHSLGPTVTAAEDNDLRAALEAFIAMPAERQRAWEADIAATATRYAWPNIAGQVIEKLRLGEAPPPTPFELPESR